MDALAWLTIRSFKSITRREYDGVLAFHRDAFLVVACLWRLHEDGRIRVTSEDHGQKFGLPAPVDAADEVNSRLAESIVSSVELCNGTLDVRIHFSSGHIFEVLPDSAGYESWDATDGKNRFIAAGGGDLAVLPGPAKLA